MDLCQPLKSLALTVVLLIGPVSTSSINAQLILNEANAVGAMNFVETDPGKLYEGYDYGVVMYSGNTNPPTAAVNPGNPFPSDLDAVTAGNQTTLPNGWNLAQATGWARILGNGGDWLEFVVTEDHTDLRGYTLYWENDDGPVNMIPGENPDERGFIKFRNHKAFADLRAGTVITLSEDNQVAERRDKYPFAPPADDPNVPGPAPHDTGYVYDLSTDTSFNPFTADDWHIHFHVDESLTDQGIDTDYFAAFSDIKVDNDDWRLFILDATNTSAQAQAEDVGVTMVSGLEVGRVQGPIGEAEPDFGANVPGGAGSVSNRELMTLRANPSSGLTAAEYEDVDFSSFGMPNVFNDLIESNLDGVQDFSALRTTVLDDTFEWTATSTADFGAAGNWQNATTQTPPTLGPQPGWTITLNNSAGGDQVAEVSSNATIRFASVMADTGTMTLQVQSGAALTVQNAPQPGRMLVMSGGTLLNNGSVIADAVEAFAGGTVSGSGTITGDLINTAGEIAPGDGVGQLTVSGDLQQDNDGVLAIEIGGLVSGQFDTVQVGGAATLNGALEISFVNGFQPTTTAGFAVLTAGSVSDLGLTLTGSAAGFSLSVVGGNQLVLNYMGSGIDGDFNNDGIYDCLDVDGLVADIVGTGTPAVYDLTGDGSVDGADLDAWLAEAGGVNLASGNAYVQGDANLDGAVDGSDFSAWNSNKFTNAAAWCSGDFNADGSVDGSDFSLWNTNKFTSSASAVPEPATGAWYLTVLALSCLSFAELRKGRM